MIVMHSCNPNRSEAAITYRGNPDQLRNYPNKGSIQTIHVELKYYECEEGGRVFRLFTSAYKMMGFTRFTPSFISKLVFTDFWVQEVSNVVYHLPLLEKITIYVSLARDVRSYQSICTFIKESRTLHTIVVSGLCNSSLRVINAASANPGITKIHAMVYDYGSIDIERFVNLRSLGIGYSEGDDLSQGMYEKLYRLAAKGKLEKLYVPNVSPYGLTQLISLPHLKHLTIDATSMTGVGRMVRNSSILTLRIGEEIYRSLKSIGTGACPPMAGISMIGMSKVDVSVICM